MGTRLGEYEKLHGQRFGMLTVVDFAGRDKWKKVMWRCKCDCGTETITLARHLKSGKCKSCGCLQRTNMGIDRKGKSLSRIYKIWYGMIYRCKVNKAYIRKGITVCEEWHDFETFRKWAYENGYDENAPRGQCTIDRIDNNGNYEPSNCRWVDNFVQARNKDCVVNQYGTWAFRDRRG